VTLPTNWQRPLFYFILFFFGGGGYAAFLLPEPNAYIGALSPKPQMGHSKNPEPPLPHQLYRFPPCVRMCDVDGQNPPQGVNCSAAPALTLLPDPWLHCSRNGPSCSDTPKVGEVSKQLHIKRREQGLGLQLLHLRAILRPPVWLLSTPVCRPLPVTGTAHDSCDPDSVLSHNLSGRIGRPFGGL
jgi:hypothetical protein